MHKTLVNGQNKCYENYLFSMVKVRNLHICGGTIYGLFTEKLSLGLGEKDF